MWSQRFFVGVCLVGAGLAGMVQGCSDPTKGVPAAVVTEAGASERAAAAEGTVYVLSDASKLDWVGSKVTGSHDGGFSDYTGTVTVPDGDLSRARIVSVIQTDSIWSDNDRLTTHLKSADFFEVETYPEAHFVSTSIREDAGQYLITGDLTLHGVTKSISFPATMQLTDDQLTLHAEFSLNRFDFGITYAGKSDDLIRENVLIKLHLEATPGAV